MRARVRLEILRGGSAQIGLAGITPHHALAVEVIGNIATANRSLIETDRFAVKVGLEAPARQITENPSVDAGVVVARMLAGEGAFGFDAARKEYVDLVEAGIIDPTKVVRVAPENAVSIASIFLQTEATMTEISEETSERHHEPDMAVSVSPNHCI
jgi:chaperonin GroEL